MTITVRKFIKKTLRRWLHNDAGARQLGRSGPNGVIASPILPDRPIHGEGLSMPFGIFVASTADAVAPVAKAAPKLTPR